MDDSGFSEDTRQSSKVMENICIVVKGRRTMIGACGPYNLGGSVTTINKNIATKHTHQHSYFSKTGTIQRYGKLIITGDLQIKMIGNKTIWKAYEIVYNSLSDL